MNRRALVLICAWLLGHVGSVAADPVFAEPGRYLSLYPALYLAGSVSREPRGRIYDAKGDKRDGVAPTYGGGSRFPLTREQAQLTWFFPWFESEQLPFISSRLWTARATLGLTQSSSQGPIGDYADAKGLVRSSDGVNDVTMEFGPVLMGSAGWRAQDSPPFSLLLLGRVRVPVGARDADSPNNAGTNAYGFGTTLGAHWRLLPRLLLDAGLHADTYTRDDEPAFGAQTPSKTGDRLAGDLTLSIRLLRGLYLSAGADGWRSNHSEYRNVRFTAHPPTAAMGMDIFPDPNTQFDGGSRLLRAGLGLTWFAAPQLRLGLSLAHPLSGRSGEFDQPYLQQMQRCQAAMNCAPAPAGSDRVDGLGAARAYADNSLTLSVAWQFRQGDFWLGR